MKILHPSFRRMLMQNRAGRSNLVYAVLVLIAFFLLAPYFGLGAFISGKHPSPPPQTDQAIQDTQSRTVHTQTDPAAMRLDDGTQIQRKRTPANDTSLAEIEALLGEKRAAKVTPGVEP